MDSGERQTPARGQGVENILVPLTARRAAHQVTLSPITIELLNPAKTGYDSPITTRR